MRIKLRDWAVWQARAGCYSQAALSSNDSKTLYNICSTWFLFCAIISTTIGSGMTTIEDTT